MKRATVIILAALAVLVLCAGCGGLNETFVRAVDSNWKVIGPDYKQYIEADGTIAERSKLIRLRTVAEFSKLVDEAMAKVDE